MIFPASAAANMTSADNSTFGYNVAHENSSEDDLQCPTFTEAGDKTFQVKKHKRLLGNFLNIFQCNTPMSF